MELRKTSIFEVDKPRVFLDIETTGFNPKRHELLEFAGIKQEFNDNAIEVLELKVQPQHIETASREALQITGYSPFEWAGAATANEAIHRIVDFLRGCVLVGHNIQFDMRFLKKYAKQYRAGMLSNLTIDTQDLAKEFLKPIGLEKVGLASVCNFIGISNDGAHRALTDAIRCKEVFDYILEGRYDSD